MNKNYKYRPSCYRNGFRWREGRKPKAMGLLYHHTSMCNALKIISTNVLFFAELKKLNDINERFRMLSYEEGCGNAAEKELACHRQLSFCIDGERPGYAIPAMWGHYGDNGQGACLVFNKAVIEANMPKNAHSGIVAYKGEYYDDADSSIVCDESNAREYFKKNISDIFFTKTMDWKYEQEFRMVVRSDNPSLPIALPLKSALVAVIIFMPEDTPDDACVFNSPAYKALKALLPNIPILALGKLRDDKASLCDGDGNVWCVGSQGAIRMVSSTNIKDIDC